MGEPRTAPSLVKHVARAAKLRCPACGKSPLFVPWYRVRCLQDWFSPLDGCPRCGYPYEREAGYYLMAIWAVNYGVGSVLGIALYLLLEWKFDLPIGQLLAAVVIPIACFNILFARHAKALFLAVDLFFDPHERGGDDDGGNKRREPSPQPVEGGGKSPCREPALLP